MKHSNFFRLLLSLYLLVCCLQAFSQEVLPPPIMSEIESKAKTKIDSLSNAGIDTIIGFYVFPNTMIPDYNDTVKGYPKSLIFDNYYILYLKSKSWNMIRLTSLLPETEGALSVVNSKPLVLSSDSSLVILKEKVSKVHQEHFLPFIMAFEVNGIKAYDIGWESHSTHYKIMVKTKADSSTHAFEGYRLYDKYPYFDNSPVNLNYPFNQSQNLYYVYTKLKNLAAELDKKFIFKPN